MLDTYMNDIDLNLLSVYRINGQEWPYLPGLMALNPPRRAARGRDQDRLLVYLTLSGNVSYSPKEYSDVVSKVAETFYNTAGSLTFALKTAAEGLNNFLIDRNMKSTGKGLYSIGSLVLCNLRGNSMYIVQSGPNHVFHFTKELRHLHDITLSGKGLGLSQTSRMYFSQVVLAPGDRMLLCAALPDAWEKSINDSHGSPAIDTTRRRLLAVTDVNVSGLLVQATEGSGQMNVIKAAADLQIDLAGVLIPDLDTNMASKPLAAEDVDLPVPVTPEVTTVVAEQHKETSAAPTNVAAQPEVERAAPLGSQVAVGRSRQQKETSEPSAQARRLSEAVRSVARLLAQTIQKGRVQFQKMVAWAEHTLPRLLPDHDGDHPQQLFSRSWAVFFAVAIPVLVIFVARIVYYRTGFEAQYKLYFDRAVNSAQQAQAQTSPTTLRVDWQATLDWLDKADQYVLEPKAEVQELRKQAQSELDKLEKIQRYNFSVAFGSSLSPNLRVLRMAASDTDIYLLDELSGSVLRGIFNGKNFDLDGSFKCAPGSYKELVFKDGQVVNDVKTQLAIGPLIDIVSLPHSGATTATLLGIDNAGHLIYCDPGEDPRVVSLALPGTGWKDITAISYNSESLYVLDAGGRAVWIYNGSNNLEFGDPTFFFGQQVPVMMEQAIGLSVDGDDLYLLHEDGHMTTCVLNRLETSTTRCNDPAMYIDTRPGYEGGMNLGDGVFINIFFTSPPDPSVALLEPYTHSIYRFSPRALELQSQIRPQAGKENPIAEDVQVTAMALSPNKMIFMFTSDGKLYFATNSP